MATLQQTLRGLPKADDQMTRGPGGVLRRTPTLQQATQQAGLAAAPTTPMAAEMTGAGPQAAKMAGTPQQLQAALQQSTEAPTLQTALRQKQFGRETTAGEAGAMQKSASMQALGGLGDRVTSMVSGEYDKLKKVDTTAGVAAEFEGKKLTPEVTGKLQQLQTTTPGTPEYNQLVADINTGLGKTPETALSAGQLQSMYQTSAQAIGGAATGTIRDPKTVKAAEFLPELGYDANSLATLLGVTPEEVQGYSLEALQDKVNQVQSQEFARTQQLEQQAVSPLAGAAERGLAREAARELSATGVRATEADMQKLNAEVSQATQVSFMGQTKSVDQWLADDEISAMIKDVVDSPADSQLRKDLQTQSPDFYAFITRNETALKAAASQLETGATQFRQLQEANKKVYRDTGLADTTIANLFPESTGFQTKAVDVTQVPVVSYLQNLTPAERQSASNEINNLAATDPAMAKQLTGLTGKQVTSLGIGKPGSNWDKLKQYNTTTDKIKQTDPQDTDTLLREAFSDVPSLDAAQQTINTGNALSALGLESGVSVTSLDPSKLQETLLAGRPAVSLTEAAAGKVPVVKKQTLGTPKLPEDGTSEAKIVHTLKSVLTDGSLSADEINDPKGPIARGTLNFDDLLTLRDLADKPGAKIDKGALDGRLNQLRAENTKQIFQQVGGSERQNTDPALDIDRWSKLLSEDPRKVDQAAVRDLITKTAVGEFQSGRYRFQYMDNSLERLKQLGLLTPDIVNEYNKAAQSRRATEIGARSFAKSSKYFYGIDAQGNPLTPPAKQATTSDRTKDGKLLVTMKKGKSTIQVEAGDQSYYERQGWKR